MEDDVGKKNSTTPSLTFPFALILNKTGSFAEKVDVARVFTLACANEHLLRNLESLVAVRLNKK